MDTTLPFTPDGKIEETIFIKGIIILPEMRCLHKRQFPCRCLKCTCQILQLNHFFCKQNLHTNFVFRNTYFARRLLIDELTDFVTVENVT